MTAASEREKNAIYTEALQVHLHGVKVSVAHTQTWFSNPVTEYSTIPPSIMN